LQLKKQKKRREELCLIEAFQDFFKRLKKKHKLTLFLSLQINQTSSGSFKELKNSAHSSNVIELFSLERESNCFTISSAVAFNTAVVTERRSEAQKA
jgi:hypothetical protein